MAQCLTACGCDDHESLTKADLDRLTDKIENVLNDEKGRKIFRNFMITARMRDGRRVLDFLEHIERLLNFKEHPGHSFLNYLRHIDKLIDDAERIEELDFATMERLTLARDSEDRVQIKQILLELKLESTKALRREYSAFRKNLLQRK